VRRPSLTAKITRGLEMVHALAQADLESGGADCFPGKDPTDAERALEYIDDLVEWYKKKGTTASGV